MNDIEAIKQLKARYFRTLDTKDWTGLRQVFADDVTIDTTESGGNVITGADAFVAFLQETLGDRPTVHHGHMPEIELVSDTEARGIWALADIVAFPDGGTLHGYGHYHESYTKTDGSWRITSLKLTRLRMEFS